MIENILNEKNILLPAAPQKGGLYAPSKSFGKYALMYVSGCGCNIDGEEIGVGKLGSLDRIKSFDKITVFVASADEFYEQPQVANGATALLQEVFGDEVGLPTRSAIGVNVLPGNIPVEIEALVSYE